MKISIFSFAVNDKFPIDIAHRYFKKYMKDNFEYIVFNDASNIQMEKNINLITSSNNISCVRVPQEIHKIHNPSSCYATTLNWAVQEYAVKNKCDIIVLVHSDVFPICEVSILDILGENILASTMEFRMINEKGVNYLYPAFTIINMNKLNNPSELDFGLAPGLDVGGNTQGFIKNHANEVKFISHHQITYFMHTLNNEPIAKYFEKDLAICRSHGLSAGWVADGFFHYMAGSQWNSGENTNFAIGHKKRMDLFLEYFY